MAPSGDTLSAARADARSVAHYGCSAGGGRLVRVALAPGVDKAPEAEVVDCPACGNQHLARFIWRRRGGQDEERPPELLVGKKDSP